MGLLGIFTVVAVLGLLIRWDIKRDERLDKEREARNEVAWNKILLEPKYRIRCFNKGMDINPVAVSEFFEAKQEGYKMNSSKWRAVASIEESMKKGFIRINRTFYHTKDFEIIEIQKEEI